MIRDALTVMAQVALADIAAIVVLPLVLEPSRALRAAGGGLLIALCVLALFTVSCASYATGHGFGRCVASPSRAAGRLISVSRCSSSLGLPG